MTWTKVFDKEALTLVIDILVSKMTKCDNIHTSVSYTNPADVLVSN